MTRGTPIPKSMTLHAPFRLVKRGGRKEMQLPVGVRPDRKADNMLVKALARAFRWKRMLESGEFATVSELAARAGIAPTYMTRVLRLSRQLCRKFRFLCILTNATGVEVLSQAS